MMERKRTAPIHDQEVRSAWQRGFSLIEVLVAMVMLALVASVLLRVFITAGRVNNRGVEITRANLVASGVSEIVKADPSAWLPSGTASLYFDEDGIRLISADPATDPDAAYRADLTVVEAGIVASPSMSLETAFLVDAFTPNDPIEELYTLTCTLDGSDPILILDGNGANQTFHMVSSIENEAVVTVGLAYLQANYVVAPPFYPDIRIQVQNEQDALLKLMTLTDTGALITVEPITGSVSEVALDPDDMETGGYRLYDIAVDVFKLANGDRLAEKLLSGYQWAAP